VTENGRPASADGCAEEVDSLRGGKVLGFAEVAEQALAASAHIVTAAQLETKRDFTREPTTTPA
jgi:hypothetical protein